MDTVSTEVALKWLSILAYWLGMAARVVLPYLKTYWEGGGQVEFDWAYVKGQVIGSFIAFLGLLAAEVTGGILDQVGAMGIVLAFLTGYFASHTGREGQKFAGAWQSYKGLESGK